MKAIGVMDQNLSPPVSHRLFEALMCDFVSNDKAAKDADEVESEGYDDW